MSAEELAVMWLRDRAKALRSSAESASGAYMGDGPMRRACVYVAAKYRAAAVLLDDAATDAEDNPSLLGARTPSKGNEGSAEDE